MSHEIAPAGFGAKWPSEKPVGVILALMMALVSTAAIVFYQYKSEWPFPQQLYLKTYLAAGLSRTLRTASYYTFPVVVDRRIGPRLAETGDVIPVVLANGQRGIALTVWAVRHGALRLDWEHGWFKNEYLYTMIRHCVFQDQTWWDLLKPACYGGLAVLFLGLCVGIPRDARATKVRREGRVVRGPLIVTRDEFNRRRTKKRGTGGIGFVTTEPQSFREKLCVRYGYGPMIQVPREDEVRHILRCSPLFGQKIGVLKVYRCPS